MNLQEKQTKKTTQVISVLHGYKLDLSILLTHPNTDLLSDAPTLLQCGCKGFFLGKVTVPLWAVEMRIATNLFQLRGKKQETKK